jgi:hypothetical protein
MTMKILWFAATVALLLAAVLYVLFVIPNRWDGAVAVNPA